MSGSETRTLLTLLYDTQSDNYIMRLIYPPVIIFCSPNWSYHWRAPVWKCSKHPSICEAESSGHTTRRRAEILPGFARSCHSLYRCRRDVFWIKYRSYSSLLFQFYSITSVSLHNCRNMYPGSYTFYIHMPICKYYTFCADVLILSWEDRKSQRRFINAANVSFENTTKAWAGQYWINIRICGNVMYTKCDSAWLRLHQNMVQRKGLVTEVVNLVWYEVLEFREQLNDWEYSAPRSEV